MGGIDQEPETDHPVYPPTPTIAQAVVWAFRRLAEEWHMVLILSAPLIVVSLIASTPLIPYYAEMFEAAAQGPQIQPNPANMEPFKLSGLGDLFVWVVWMVGGSGIFVVMARLTDMDRGMLLEGGLGVFTKRASWTIWRLISAVTLMMIITTIVLFLLTPLLPSVNPSIDLVTGSENSSEIMDLEGPSGVEFWIIIVAVATIAMAILSALSISVYAASRDVRIGILATWKALKGCRTRLIIINFIIYFVFVPVFMLPEMLFRFFILESYWTTTIIYYVGFLLLTGIQIFLWLTVGAAFANYALSGRYQPS